MNLFVLLMSLADRTTLVQVRKDVLVITAIADGQGAIAVGATIEDRTITDTAPGPLGTRLSLAVHAGKTGMRMVFHLARQDVEQRGKAKRHNQADEHQILIHSGSVIKCYYMQ